MSVAADRAPLAGALALVPGLEYGAAALAVQRLTGGSVNHVWRVDTSRGRFVLRTDAAASLRPGVDRAREAILQTLAAAAAIAPPILARSPGGDVQVTPFIEARQWQQRDYRDAAQLRRLGELLARLHAIPAPADMPAFAPAALALDYARAGLTAGSGPDRTAHATGLCAVVARAQAWLQAAAGALHVVHGDPTEGNVLDHRRLWLIDWEYAQAADPLYDLGAVLAYYPAARRNLRELLAAAGMPAAGADGRLAAAVRIHLALWWLWRHARGGKLRRRVGKLARHFAPQGNPCHC